jgi:hypothetical protein
VAGWAVRLGWAGRKAEALWEGEGKSAGKKKDWAERQDGPKVTGKIPALQCLPSYICHLLSTSRTRGWTSMLADHLLPVEDLNGEGKLHAPWPRDTLDLVHWGPGDTQLEQQTVKLRGNRR